ncbi:MAG: hypothetical protein HY827_10310 [Actinobacteria bacterium]|nr:hypothetical protein [Actinomycetota bacterium]
MSTTATEAPTFKISTGGTHGELRDLLIAEAASTREAVNGEDARRLNSDALDGIDRAFDALDARYKSGDHNAAWPQIELPLSEAADVYLWGVMVRAADAVRLEVDKDSNGITNAIATASDVNVWLRDFRQERDWEDTYGGGDVTLDVPPECAARLIAFFRSHVEYDGSDSSPGSLASGLVEQLTGGTTITAPVRYLAAQLTTVIGYECDEWREEGGGRDYGRFMDLCDRMKALRTMLAQIDGSEAVA